MPVFQLVVCLSVTLHIVDLWQYYVYKLLYKIRCNQMHPLNGALPVPYVSVLVTRNDLMEHRYTYEPPLYRTSQYRKTFIPLSVSLCNELADPVFNGVGLLVVIAGPLPFHSPMLLLLSFVLLLFSMYLLSFYKLLLWGRGLRTDRE